MDVAARQCVNCKFFSVHDECVTKKKKTRASYSTSKGDEEFRKQGKQKSLRKKSKVVEKYLKQEREKLLQNPKI